MKYTENVGQETKKSKTNKQTDETKKNPTKPNGKKHIQTPEKIDCY